eukprot:CAMPEP_0202106626 /NCGR_PEP_ID=MMETSP0965-20130614/11641_1 /ASSEMBLY_ACC=CAM_ASM_000507 /TAXON_ID=4773 /ORGANISM="Schizochytrium aggregatum, Strain ATCC28209" /LENGTH=32 /DNA_ID= /DNA_START= /DNA_END= /DNA_ORIENTATION=
MTRTNRCCSREFGQVEQKELRDSAAAGRPLSN